MEDQGSGAVQILVAIDLGAVSHVYIFQIGKMILVKKPDLLESGPAVDCRAGTGGEDLVRFGVIRCRPAASPGDAPAHQGVEIPGSVDQLWMIHLQHLAGDREDTGRLFYSMYHLFQKMRIHGGVVIQQQDIRRPGMPDPDIDGLAETIVLIKGKNLDIRIVPAQIFEASVRGSIVYDKDTAVLEGLFFQGSQTRLHEAAAVIIRDYDCNFHMLNSCLIPILCLRLLVYYSKYLYYVLY